MSPEIPTLVQTSTNLAVVETGSDAVQVVMLTRSALARSKAALTTRVSAACSACGFEYVFEGDYPGWKPEPGNSLVKSVSAVHESLFGKPMQVVAVHGGLECGLIGEKHPGMEMVSLGPNMWDVHTPDERVSVRSVAAFWKLLTRILETL